MSSIVRGNTSPRYTVRLGTFTVSMAGGVAPSPVWALPLRSNTVSTSGSDRNSTPSTCALKAGTAKRPEIFGSTS